MTNVSAVIVNYNDWESTYTCINALSCCPSIDDIVVVDNHSPNDSLVRLKDLQNTHPFHLLKAKENGGYGKGNNLGAYFAIHKLDADIIIILNPDVTLTPDSVDTVLEALSNNPDYKILAPEIIDTSGKNTHQGWVIRSFVEELLHMFSVTDRLFIQSRIKPIEKTGNIERFDCVTGACLFVEAKAFQQVKGYDPRVFLFYEENILGIKMRQRGYKTGIVVNSHFKHGHSKTINKAFPSNIKKLQIRQESREILMRYYLGANDFQMFLYTLWKPISYFDLFLIALKRTIINKETWQIPALFREIFKK